MGTSAGRARTGWRVRRRAAALAVVIAALALVIAACGGSNGGDSGGGGKGGTTTLTFLNAQDPGTFNKFVAAFEKANPDIKVKLQTLPFDDLNAAVQSRVGQKDSSIDLYEVDEPRLAGFAARG